MTEPVRYSNVTLYRRLLDQARPYWPHIAAILFLDALATPLALLKPIPLKIAVDSVIGRAPLPWFLDAILPGFATASPLRLLSAAAVLQVAVILLAHLQDLGAYGLRTYTGEWITLGFRARLLRHVQRLSLSFHDSRGTADSIYRVEHDAPAIQWITLYGLLSVLSSAFMLVVMFAVLARINWRLALVALAVAPFVFLMGHAYDRGMRGRYLHVKELESHALKVVQEMLTAVRVVKAFGREDAEAARFTRHSSEGLRERVRLALAEGGIVLAVNFTTAIGLALVLFIGVRDVQSGAMTLGELLVVITYLSQLYTPLEAISNQLAHLQSSLAGARRAFELLDEAPDVPERPDARPLERAAGAISFRSVSFAYDGRNLILRDVSFSVPPRTRLGIVGRSGAGKTTLLSLLARFYDPASGEILLDDVDLREIRLSDLRNQFAIVLQEPVLFSTSIAENIAYGRSGASQREIEDAARLSNAHDFILRLPQGYRTQVGERGMALSGGERQRISLARAFLKDAPILLLDEPTSSVDTDTELMILEAVERLMRGRTTFIIAHRLSTLEKCNALLVVEDGQLVTMTSDVSATIRDPFILSGGDSATRGMGGRG